MRKKAGEAISQGLRKGGDYKVAFFVTEQAGRIVQQDATTIRLVLEAAPEIKNRYGIIVNMISKGVLRRLKQKDNGYYDFINTIFAGITDNNKCLYSSILLIGKISDLEDEDNIVVPPETFKDPEGQTLLHFIQNVVPTISIKSENVADINVEKFEEMTFHLEKLAKELQSRDEAWKEEKRKLELKRNEEAAKHQKQIDELLAAQKQQIDQTSKEKNQLVGELQEKIEMLEKRFQMEANVSSQGANPYIHPQSTGYPHWGMAGFHGPPPAATMQYFQQYGMAGSYAPPPFSPKGFSGPFVPPPPPPNQGMVVPYPLYSPPSSINRPIDNVEGKL